MRDEARFGVFKLPFLFVAVALSSAWAVDPATLISQYSHTSWKTSDGPLGYVNIVTQTTDGHIWINSSTQGLTRYDGTRFTPWTPPKGHSAPAGVNYLLGARDGSLWIATSRGLLRLKGDELYDFSSQFAGAGVNRMIEDHNGTVWFTRYRIQDGTGPLCRIAGNQIHCYGANDGIPARYGLGLAEDSAGNIWFGSNVLYRWSPGSSTKLSTFFEDETKHTGGDGVSEIWAGPSGSIWAALDGVGPKLGLRYYSAGKWTGYVVPGFNGANARVDQLFMDRNHSLWIGVESQGIYRIHNGVAQHYGSLDGLTGKSPQYFYEDREGGLWVVTEAGIDLFRDKPVVTYASGEGLLATNITAILALHNGSVWVADNGTLEVINPDGVSVIATGPGLAGQDPQGMFEDHAGRVWIGFNDRIMTYEQGRFAEIRKENGSLLGHVGLANGFAEDGDSTLWALIRSKTGDQNHLLRIRDGRVRESISLDSLFGHVNSVAADPKGGLWISGRSAELARFRDGRFETFSLANGDITFTKYSVFVDGDGVWVSTNRGLFHWKDGRSNVMDTRSGLPCSVIYSAIADNNGDFWLYSRCGVLRISASDLAAWLKLPGARISAKTFDQLDGAMAGAGATDNQPRTTKSPDGRIWFMTDTRVQMIDPGRSWADPNPPPVYIAELLADHKSYDLRQALSLPHLRGELEVDYTALSLAVPQRVRFRYKLEGHDTEWQDPGTRRQAFYTDLGPGKYRFQVVASNKDGVWNMKGADLSFRIAPTWYQSIWFRLASAAALLLLLGGLYRYRLHQIALEFNTRLDERVNERTRIARELHDTLLQSFHGLLFRFQAARNMLPRRPDEAIQALDGALIKAEQAIAEGRNAIQDLRSEPSGHTDLEQLLTATGQELEGSQDAKYPASFSLTVEGKRQAVSPILQDEVYRIGRELLRNAFRHAHAKHIEAEIRYDHAQLRLRIRDDGKGMDPNVLKEGGRSGHWGLPGIHERAKRIGARLDLWSNTGAGTEVELTVPASVAYGTSGRRARYRLFRKKAANA
jgi:signal transduction histidine kinase/streptogramin lyase